LPPLEHQPVVENDVGLAELDHVVARRLVEVRVHTLADQALDLGPVPRNVAHDVGDHPDGGDGFVTRWVGGTGVGVCVEHGRHPNRQGEHGQHHGQDQSFMKACHGLRSSFSTTPAYTAKQAYWRPLLFGYYDLYILVCQTKRSEYSK
jgi:hypothetical protein